MEKIILASQSKGRTDMLKGAGLLFDNHPANLDEASVLTDMLARNALPSDIAQRLASDKALSISEKFPDHLIIGSDQVLSFHAQILGKAPNADLAIERLKDMRGKVHHLISSVSVVKNGEILWQTTDRASLTMYNDLGNDFFDLYKEKAGDALTKSVGGYWLEDIGSWLFRQIEGNYFTILGMPLLPLLAYLRSHHNIYFDK